MARYKQPLVVKEIFLPLAYSDDGSSIEKYKEKYGIDLSEIFDFGDWESLPDSSSVLFTLKIVAKFYFIDLDGFASGIQVKNAVYPVSFIDTENGKCALCAGSKEGTAYISLGFFKNNGAIQLEPLGGSL